MTSFFFYKKIIKILLNIDINKTFRRNTSFRIVFSLSASWWKISKFKQSFNALCNKIKSKWYLFDISMKLPKLIKNSAKGRLPRNWSREFVIVPTYFNIKKQYEVFTFGLRCECNLLILTIYITSDFFDVVSWTYVL